jgi:transcriptional regulator with PAS, ATPase and Fis domain
MARIQGKIQSVARSMATVFITGESGTGKELCALAVHDNSTRAAGPFIALNCGAIPQDLLESEVFGHMKGSFTGAISDKPGAAAAADGGTLFLDEICEMAPALQTKLLRFLQTSTVQPVGATRPRKVNVRIVCATNRDPLDAVRSGQFR